MKPGVALQPLCQCPVGIEEQEWEDVFILSLFMIMCLIIVISFCSFKFYVHSENRRPNCCISVLQYLDMGQHQMALNAWRNATLLKPKHLNAWSNMVILLDNIG